MNWINQDIFLAGNHVTLVPLTKSHFDELLSVSKNKAIWKHYAIDGNNTAKLRESLENALTEKSNGTQYPFCILHEGKIIGSTRFLEMQPIHKKMEIGWTWIHPLYWGTKVNLECKYLLLGFCFEELSARRVQFKTDEKNIRSRTAIEKIGASPEGLFRNDMIRDNGAARNSIYFSIIDSEWPLVKQKLSALLGQ